jgi:putative holliday junction resolvase
MKRVALDYGRARIGVACCDPEGICVQGLPTIERKRTPNAVAAVAAVIAREAPAEVVVGLPLSIDDEETAMSREARAFAAEVEKASGVKVVFVDESFSSVHAHELLRGRKRKDRRNKAMADRLAACLILEQYLREQHEQ